MSILIRFEPDSLTTAQYEESLRLLRESDDVDFPPKGMEYHVCFGPEGNLAVSEIWASRKESDAFGEHLMPILDKAGIKFSGEPKYLDVHNSVTQ